VSLNYLKEAILEMLENAEQSGEIRRFPMTWAQGGAKAGKSNRKQLSE